MIGFRKSLARLSFAISWIIRAGPCLGRLVYQEVEGVLLLIAYGSLTIHARGRIDRALQKNPQVDYRIFARPRGDGFELAFTATTQEESAFVADEHWQRVDLEGMGGALWTEENWRGRSK